MGSFSYSSQRNAAEDRKKRNHFVESHRSQNTGQIISHIILLPDRMRKNTVVMFKALFSEQNQFFSKKMIFSIIATHISISFSKFQLSQKNKFRRYIATPTIVTVIRTVLGLI
jgi:hypothetical protein